MAFISFNSRVAEHRTRFVFLGETPSPRVRCQLALLTYLLTATVTVPARRRDETSEITETSEISSVRDREAYRTGHHRLLRI